jgi:hypothetical protein
MRRAVLSTLPPIAPRAPYHRELTPERRERWTRDLRALSAEQRPSMLFLITEHYGAHAAQVIQNTLEDNA